MDPFTIAMISGVGLEIFGKISAANAKKQQLRAQAQFEESQAAIALQDASYEAFRARMAGADKGSAAKVAYAASGVDSNLGTARDTREQIAIGTQMDATMAEVKGRRIAWTHKEKARLLRQGVEDVNAALPLDIASSVIGGYTKRAGAGDIVNEKQTVLGG